MDNNHPLKDSVYSKHLKGFNLGLIKCGVSKIFARGTLTTLKNFPSFYANSTTFSFLVEVLDEKHLAYKASIKLRKKSEEILVKECIRLFYEYVNEVGHSLGYEHFKIAESVGINLREPDIRLTPLALDCYERLDSQYIPEDAILLDLSNWDKESAVLAHRLFEDRLFGTDTAYLYKGWKNYDRLPKFCFESLSYNGEKTERVSHVENLEVTYSLSWIEDGNKVKVFKSAPLKVFVPYDYKKARDYGLTTLPILINKNDPPNEDELAELYFETYFDQTDDWTESEDSLATREEAFREYATLSAIRILYQGRERVQKIIEHQARRHINPHLWQCERGEYKLLIERMEENSAAKVVKIKPDPFQ